MFTVTKKYETQLRAVAEVVEVENYKTGLAISAWFTNYFCTYFFENDQLIGTYTEYGKQKHYVGKCTIEPDEVH
jgi:hypothetical protein